MSISKMRDCLTVIANLTRVRDVSSKSLNNNIMSVFFFVNGKIQQSHPPEIN